MATTNVFFGQCSEKSVNIDSKCKVCGKKVVNGVSCDVCSDFFHFKCANISSKDTYPEKWICNICSNVKDLEDSFHEVRTLDMSQMEINFILSENKLLKKLLQEMEEKNSLLKEKINFLISTQKPPPEGKFYESANSEQSVVENMKSDDNDVLIIGKSEPSISNTPKPKLEASSYSSTVRATQVNDIKNKQIPRDQPVVHKQSNMEETTTSSFNNKPDHGFQLVTRKKSKKRTN